MIISVRNLEKVFESRSKGKTTQVKAVRGIDLNVKEGEVYGLLGPNGAGKTTTMRMIATLITPTAGTVEVAGFDLATQAADVRKTIGFVSQTGGLERSFTGRENLVLQGELYGLSRKDAGKCADELIDRMDASAFANRKVETYSGGQKRILDLAVGIVHKSKILFLDEPTTGLDPKNRAHVWAEVERMQKQGTTIILTTHYLEETDALSDRIAIIDTGKIIAEGSPSELKRKLSGDVVTLSIEDDFLDRSETLINEQAFVEKVAIIESGLQVFVENGEKGLIEIVRLLDKENISIHSASFSEPSLDDVFLNLTGRSIEGATGDESQNP